MEITLLICGAYVVSVVAYVIQKERNIHKGKKGFK
jgi:hypothetical protein